MPMKLSALGSTIREQIIPMELDQIVSLVLPAELSLATAVEVGQRVRACMTLLGYEHLYCVRQVGKIFKIWRYK